MNVRLELGSKAKKAVIFEPKSGDSVFEFGRSGVVCLLEQIEAGEEGAVGLEKVELGERAGGDFEVADSGIGVDLHVVEMLYDRVQQRERGRDVGGHGRGMGVRAKKGDLQAAKRQTTNERQYLCLDWPSVRVDLGTPSCEPTSQGHFVFIYF